MDAFIEAANEFLKADRARRAEAAAGTKIVPFQSVIVLDEKRKRCAREDTAFLCCTGCEGTDFVVVCQFGLAVRPIVSALSCATCFKNVPIQHGMLDA